MNIKKVILIPILIFLIFPVLNGKDTITSKKEMLDNFETQELWTSRVVGNKKGISAKVTIVEDTLEKRLDIKSKYLLKIDVRISKIQDYNLYIDSPNVLMMDNPLDSVTLWFYSIGQKHELYLNLLDENGKWKLHNPQYLNFYGWKKIDIGVAPPRDFPFPGQILVGFFLKLKADSLTLGESTFYIDNIVYETLE